MVTDLPLQYKERGKIMRKNKIIASIISLFLVVTLIQALPETASAELPTQAYKVGFDEAGLFNLVDSGVHDHRADDCNRADSEMKPESG